LVAAAVKVVAMAEVAAVEVAAVVAAAETSSSILDVAPDVSSTRALPEQWSGKYRLRQRKHNTPYSQRP
jgi:hypothetical protein